MSKCTDSKFDILHKSIAGNLNQPYFRLAHTIQWLIVLENQMLDAKRTAMIIKLKKNHHIKLLE